MKSDYTGYWKSCHIFADPISLPSLRLPSLQFWVSSISRWNPLVSTFEIDRIAVFFLQTWKVEAWSYRKSLKNRASSLTVLPWHSLMVLCTIPVQTFRGLLILTLSSLALQLEQIMFRSSLDTETAKDHRRRMSRSYSINIALKETTYVQSWKCGLLLADSIGSGQGHAYHTFSMIYLLSPLTLWFKSVHSLSAKIPRCQLFQRLTKSWLAD